MPKFEQQFPRNIPSILNEWMNERTNERKNERMNEWMNEESWMRGQQTYPLTIHFNMWTVSSDVSIQRRHWQPLSVHLWAYCTHPTHSLKQIRFLTKLSVVLTFAVRSSWKASITSYLRAEKDDDSSSDRDRFRDHPIRIVCKTRNQPIRWRYRPRS